MTQSKQETASVSQMSISEGMKKRKFNKKVTWSCQLETVKVITPEITKSTSKFKVFSVKEEDEEEIISAQVSSLQSQKCICSIIKCRTY